MTLTHLEMEQPEGLHSAVVLVSEQSDCCMPEAVGRTAPTVMTVGHRGLRVNSSYRAMLCIRGTSHGLDSVRPMCSSVCPSVTSRSSTKTAKRRITQTTPHGDIPGTLVFLKPKISAKFDRNHPIRGRQMQVGWSKSATFDKWPAISRKRYKIDTYFLLKSNRKLYAQVHMFIKRRPTVTLQLYNFDLFSTCRTSSFCTVAWQLARFQLTRRIARSLGDSWASCYYPTPPDQRVYPLPVVPVVGLPRSSGWKSINIFNMIVREHGICTCN